MNLPDTQFFLDALYSDALDRKAGNLVIWSPQNKMSDFHASTRTAAESVVDRVNNHMDVYYGLGLIRKPLPKGRRGRAADVGCLTCFWCDLDIQHDVHKKKRLPPDEEAALGLLDRLEHEPSMVIRSGHGLQPYWLFSEPWSWDASDVPEHDRAAAAAKQWVTHMQAAAQAAGGWTLDSVGDISRVFRVPGTTNFKRPEEPVDVTILVRNGPVYHVDDLIEESKASSVVIHQAKGGAPDVRGGRILLSSAAEPPSGKLDALRENDRRFDQTWTRKRVLDSASEYDMALANATVASGWSDQETINLLIAHRRNHGDDLKLRLDYYTRTLRKARESQDRSEDENRVFDVLDDLIAEPPGNNAVNAPQSTEPLKAATGAKKDIEPHTPAATPTAGRPALMSAVSKLLGFQVSRWIQRGREPRRAEYSLILPDNREVLIGNSAAFMKAMTFRCSILDATSIIIPCYKAAKWDKICKALMAAVEIIENDEMRRDNQVIEWLRQYTRGGVLYDDNNWSLALMQNDPFILGEMLHVHVITMVRFLRMSLGENATKYDLYGALGTIGFHNVRKTARVEGEDKPVCRSYFAGPIGVLAG